MQLQIQVPAGRHTGLLISRRACKFLADVCRVLQHCTYSELLADHQHSLQGQGGNNQSSRLALKPIVWVHCLLIPDSRHCNHLQSWQGEGGVLCTPQLFAAFVSDRCCPESTYLLAMRAQKGHCACHWTGGLVVLSPFCLSLLHKNFDSEQHPSCQLLVPRPTFLPFSRLSSEYCCRVATQVLLLQTGKIVEPASCTERKSVNQSIGDQPIAQKFWI